MASLVPLFAAESLEFMFRIQLVVTSDPDPEIGYPY
jgi:hypothetical protein